MRQLQPAHANTSLGFRRLLLTPGPLSPKGARGELILLPSPPLGERVARRGVFISQGETGEGVSPTVKSNMGRHTSFRRSADFQPALSRQDGGATFRLGQHRK